MNFPNQVIIREVGPREGMQIEDTPVSTEDKIRMIDMLSECSIPIIEVTSFVSPKWVPNMSDAELIARGFKNNSRTQYQALYLNAKGIERAMQTNKFNLEGVLSITASETFSKKNTNLTIEETLEKMDERIHMLKKYNISIDTIAVMTAFGCLYEGDTIPQKVINLISKTMKKAESYGECPNKILLGDTVGWANPVSTKLLIDKVQQNWPNKEIILHLHDTRGMGIANAYVGLQMGVKYFDASVGGLGGCPFSGAGKAAGNIVTEELVHMCDELGIQTGIDLEKLLKVTEEIEEILGRSLPGKVSKGGSLNFYRTKHEEY